MKVTRTGSPNVLKDGEDLGRCDHILPRSHVVEAVYYNGVDLTPTLTGDLPLGLDMT